MDTWDIFWHVFIFKSTACHSALGQDRVRVNHTYKTPIGKEKLAIDNIRKKGNYQDCLLHNIHYII